MITPHSILRPKISTSDIDFIAEREGYTRYIPYTFVKHLAYAYSYKLVGLPPKTCIQESNSYTKIFGEVLDTINYRQVDTNNPIKFAIRVLKLIGRRANLRELETAAITGLPFTVESEPQYQNYKCDIDSLSDVQLEVIGIKRDEIETMELSDEIQQILIFYDGLNVLKQTIDTKYDVIKQQIRSFSDFFKVRKYKLALPTFNVDLGMKKHQITKVDDSEVYTSEAIIAIDHSISMGYTTNARSLIRSILLYYIGQLEKVSNLTVTLVDVVGRVRFVEKFTNLGTLSGAFHRELEFMLPVAPVETIFSDLNKLYPGRSVVFISDGKMPLKDQIKLKFQLYSIVLDHNEILKQMSLLSGGQFIVLK